MHKLLKRISRFRKRHISSKAVAIWALNKKLPSEWGSIKDLSLDNDANTLTVQVTQKNDSTRETSIEIHNYQVNVVGDDALLSWEKIIVTGERKGWFLKKFKHHNNIAIPPAYVMLVEKLNKRKRLTTQQITAE